MNDARQLLYELEVAIKIHLPNADHNQLKFLFEGILQNYEIEKKNADTIKNDFQEKIDLYIDALSIEGFSVTTLKGYKEELKLFSAHVQKPIALVTTADIRTYLGLNPNLKKGTISKKLSVIKAFLHG